METIRDFEDMLELLSRHDVKYFVVGGLAFIRHWNAVEAHPFRWTFRGRFEQTRLVRAA